MDRWKGRVALVTGAAAGIGASICEELIRYGIQVIGCDKDMENMDKLSKMYEPGVFRVIKCDLRNEQEILLMFDVIRKDYGRIDICINNAGFSTKHPLLSGNSDDLRAVFEVNVLALCICTKEAVKLMVEKGIDDGQVIQLCSQLAHQMPKFPSLHFYAGAKTMVKVLTEGFRRELEAMSSHIRMTSICPGIVETEFMNRTMRDAPGAKELFQSFQPLYPSDVAAIVISILQQPPRVNVNDIVMQSVEYYTIC